MHLGMRYLGLLLMIFGLFGVVSNAEEGLFRAYSQAGGPTVAGSSAFLAEVCYGFVAGVWEAELLVVRALAGYIGLGMVMKLMCIALSIL